MLDPNGGDSSLWPSEELGNILRHQLEAPLVFDLGRIAPDWQRMQRLLDEGSEGGERPLNCFGDLFRHPRPPIELLQLTKEFAKGSRVDPDCPLPIEIATFLYYATLASSLVHHHHRMTRMDNDALRCGLRWVLEQPWIEADIRILFQEAVARIDAGVGES
jgi:hypothetical protein